MTVNRIPVVSSRKDEPNEVRIETIFLELERPDRVVNELTNGWKHGPK